MNREFQREGNLWVPKRDIIRPPRHFPIRRRPRHTPLAALSHVASLGWDFGAVTSGSKSITPGGAGHLLVFAVFCGGSGVTFGISDDKGNQWFTAVPYFEQTSTVWAMQAFYCKNCAAGATNITFTATGASAFFSYYGDEFTGHNTTQPLDQHSSATGSGTTLNSGAKTTLAANEIIWGFEVGNGTPTKGASFTLGQTQSGNLTEWKIVSSTGSYSADYTQTPTNQWACGMATFADINMTPAITGTCTQDQQVLL